MLKLLSHRYRRYIVLSCAVLLILAGAQLAGLYASVVPELAYTTNVSPGLNLGAASLIANIFLIGMFGGHLALFGLAALGLMTQTDECKIAVWLGGISWVGMACVSVIAVVLIGELESSVPEERFYMMALAAYVIAGATLFTMRLADRKMKSKRDFT